jgi:hypothetical protein
MKQTLLEISYGKHRNHGATIKGGSVRCKQCGLTAHQSKRGLVQSWTGYRVQVVAIDEKAVN